MSISVVKFSASGCGVGQRTEYCDSNKNGGYSNLRLNSKPFRCCILSQARTMTWRLIRFIPVGQKRHLSLEVRAGSGDVRPRLVTTKQCHHQIMIAGPADQKQTHSSSEQWTKSETLASGGFYNSSVMLCHPSAILYF